MNHKSYKEWPGIKPDLRGERPANEVQNHDNGLHPFENLIRLRNLDIRYEVHEIILRWDSETRSGESRDKYVGTINTAEFLLAEEISAKDLSHEFNDKRMCVDLILLGGERISYFFFLLP
jgi:hypothetical protein